MSGAQPFSRNNAMVAAAVGAGVLMGAAALLLYYGLEDRKKLKLLQENVKRLDVSLSEMYQELLTRQREHLQGSRQSLSSNSKSEYETADEMLSAQSTDDDDVFYDCVSEDQKSLSECVSVCMSTRSSKKGRRKSVEAKLFEEVDSLMDGDDKDRLCAFNLLKKNESKMLNNPDFLWRYAKAHQVQAVAHGAQKDIDGKKKFVLKGLEYASIALKLDKTNPDVHKWFAILTGMQGEFMPLKGKIQNACLFYEHVLLAIKDKPEDYSLHHLLGRFKFEVASTSWLERKLASSIFSEIPDVSFTDAIHDLHKAEKLNPRPWKENRLLLARCYLKVCQFDKALQWLDSTVEITPRTKDDKACDEEAKILLSKHKKHRK